MRLINFYYDAENSIPEITQPVMRRLRLVDYPEIVDVILAEYFTLRDGFWWHKRCDMEINTYHGNADKNRANGRQGGRPKKITSKRKQADKPKITQPVISGNPNITLTSNQELLNNNHKKELSTDSVNLTPAAPHRIFDYWCRVMNKNGSTKLTPKRLKAIKARIKDGYSEADIITAIDNCASDNWSMGENDRQTAYNDIELICRTGEKLESFAFNEVQKRAPAESTRHRTLEEDLTDTTWAH